MNKQMSKNADYQKLDRYINRIGLTDEELRYMWVNQIKMFAYGIKDKSDYERIQGNVALIQKSYGRGVFLKEISYILDHSTLTKWQKFWLKFQYVFL